MTGGYVFSLSTIAGGGSTPARSRSRWGGGVSRPQLGPDGRVPQPGPAGEYPSQVQMGGTLARDGVPPSRPGQEVPQPGPDGG